jgi:hypothetical protein
MAGIDLRRAKPLDVDALALALELPASERDALAAAFQAALPPYPQLQYPPESPHALQCPLSPQPPQFPRSPRSPASESRTAASPLSSGKRRTMFLRKPRLGEYL